MEVVHDTRGRGREVIVPMAPGSGLDVGAAIVGDVELPPAITASLDAVRGTPSGKVAGASLVDAIRAARRRGVTVETLQADLRKAAGQAAEDADEKGKDVRPVQVINRAARYAEHSRVEAPKPSLAALSAASSKPTRTGNPNRPLVKIGAVHVDYAMAWKIADEFPALGDDLVIDALVKAASGEWRGFQLRHGGYQSEPVSTVEDVRIALSWEQHKRAEAVRLETELDWTAWATVSGQTDPTAASWRQGVIGAEQRFRGFRYLYDAGVKRRSMVLAQYGQHPLPFQHSSAIDRFRWRCANEARVAEFLAKHGITSFEAVVAASWLGDAQFSKVSSDLVEQLNELCRWLDLDFEFKLGVGYADSDPNRLDAIYLLEVSLTSNRYRAGNTWKAAPINHELWRAA